MKPNFFPTERGQALIIIALAAIGLFGMVGLAIDMSAKFSDRRHAQNAADSAALAGSLALVNDDEYWYLEALNRASDNGYTDDHLRSDVWTFRCDDAVADRDGAPVDCGPYEGDDNYIAVVVRSYMDTTFARVIGIAEMENTVSTVTYWSKRGPVYDGNLIVALNPNACSGGGAAGNVALGTSGGSGSQAIITLKGGGAFVNSGGSGCGMELMGCPTITITDGSLGSTGTANIHLSSNSQGCQDKLTLPAPDYSQEPYEFPPDMPDEPDICSTAQPSAPTNNSTLKPGYYSEFPPTKGAYKNLSKNLTLESGIYCLDDDLALTNGESITGSNVLIYLQDGHVFSIQGGTLTLSGREEGDYEGYVLIGASNFSGQVPNCDINGNATATFTGTIFTPYCDITLDGGAHTTSLSAQIIAYTVKITGSQAVNLTYDADDNAQNDPKVGLIR